MVSAGVAYFQVLIVWKGLYNFIRSYRILNSYGIGACTASIFFWERLKESLFFLFLALHADPLRIELDYAILLIRYLFQHLIKVFSAHHHLQGFIVAHCLFELKFAYGSVLVVHTVFDLFLGTCVKICNLIQIVQALFKVRDLGNIWEIIDLFLLWLVWRYNIIFDSFLLVCLNRRWTVLNKCLRRISFHTYNILFI